MHPGDLKPLKQLKPRLQQRGFTYVAMLFALAIFGIGLAAIGEAWSAASHRDKEEELIQIGNAYVQAIASYYLRSPGTAKTYPARLDELVDDKRFVGAERHLRHIYRDPFTNRVDWALVRAPDGGIIGIHSLSEQATLRQQAMSLAHASLIVGSHYSDWKFMYEAKP